MKVLLDSSVILAASASAIGASREIFRRASSNNWSLITTHYVIEEVLHNLPKFAPSATAEWTRLRTGLILMDDVLTASQPVVFRASKDRPILFSALASADVLLTLDQGDFGELMNQTFYGLNVLKPGTFLHRERTSGRLI